jgi:hypothetical protein
MEERLLVESSFILSLEPSDAGFTWCLLGSVTRASGCRRLSSSLVQESFTDTHSYNTGQDHADFGPCFPPVSSYSCPSATTPQTRLLPGRGYYPSRSTLRSHHSIINGRPLSNLGLPSLETIQSSLLKCTRQGRMARGGTAKCCNSHIPGGRGFHENSTRREHGGLGYDR